MPNHESRNFDPGGPPHYSAHHFNAAIAEDYGIPAALLFSYFCFCADKTGQPWVGKSLNELTTLYPYLKRGAVRGALDRLCINTRSRKGPVQRDVRSTEVTYYKPDLSRQTGREHSFSVAVAVDVGLLPAIVYANIGRHILSKWKDATEALASELDPADYDNDPNLLNDFVYNDTRSRAIWWLSPKEWWSTHPYAKLRSVERAFDALVEKHYLLKKTNPRRVPGWHYPRAEMDRLQNTLLKHKDYEKNPEWKKGINSDQAGVDEMEFHRHSSTVTAKLAQSPPQQHSSPPNQHSAKSQSSMPAEVKPTSAKPLWKTVVEEDRVEEDRNVEDNNVRSPSRPSRALADAGSFLKLKSKPVEPVKTEGMVDPTKTKQAMLDWEYEVSRQEAIAAGLSVESTQEEDDDVTESDLSLSQAEFQALVLSRRNGHSGRGANRSASGAKRHEASQKQVAGSRGANGASKRVNGPASDL